MEVPAFLQEVIDRRCNHVLRLQSTTVELDNWLRSNNIRLPKEYTGLGSEVINNPIDARQRVIDAIHNHKSEKK